MSKGEIIERGELGLSAHLRAAGLRLAALATDPPRGGAPRLMGENPAQFLWRPLIEQDGVPFVKIELLRDNPRNIGDLASLAEIARARAPDLAASIDSFLKESRAATPAPRALSRQAFALRDDAFARRRAPFRARANWLAWRLLRSTRQLLRRSFGSDGSP